MPRSARARALGDLLRRGLPVADGGENIKLNGCLHRGSLLVGVEGLKEPPGVGHAAAPEAFPQVPWDFPSKLRVLWAGSSESSSGWHSVSRESCDG